MPLTRRPLNYFAYLNQQEREVPQKTWSKVSPALICLQQVKRNAPSNVHFLLERLRKHSPVNILSFKFKKEQSYIISTSFVIDLFCFGLFHVSHSLTLCVSCATYFVVSCKNIFVTKFVFGVFLFFSKSHWSQTEIWLIYLVKLINFINLTKNLRCVNNFFQLLFFPKAFYQKWTHPNYAQEKCVPWNIKKHFSPFSLYIKYKQSKRMISRVFNPPAVFCIMFQ